MKILIADDNESILMVLEEYARNEQFEVVLATDGEDALNKFEQEAPDIILLDVMMPKLDGFAVCRKIRKTSVVPIIMITARGEDFERIMGLDIGADDYIIKPFSGGEVMARVRAIMRRTEFAHKPENNDCIFIYDHLFVDISTYKVNLNNISIPLTKKEIEILWQLVSSQERVYTRDQLLNTIWGYEYFGDVRTVDTHIKRLRGKLDLFPHPKWSIKTIRGVGYRFEVMPDEK